MLENYHDNEAMAAYGREQVRYRAIKTAKEGIRDCAARILAYREEDDILKVKAELDSHMVNLLEAIRLSSG